MDRLGKNKKGPLISVANLDHRNARLPKATSSTRSFSYGRGARGAGRSALEDPEVKVPSQFGYNTASYYATPHFDTGFRTEEEREAQREESNQRHTQEKMFNMFAKLKPLPFKSPRALDAKGNLHFELVATKAPEVEFSLHQQAKAKGRLKALEVVEAVNNGSHSARHIGPPKLPALKRVQSGSIAGGTAAARMDRMVNRVPKPSRLNPKENDGYFKFTQNSFTKVLHTQPAGPVKARKSLVSMDSGGRPVVVVKEMQRNITHQTDVDGDHNDQERQQDEHPAGSNQQQVVEEEQSPSAGEQDNAQKQDNEAPTSAAADADDDDGKKEALPDQEDSYSPRREE